MLKRNIMKKLMAFILMVSVVLPVFPIQTKAMFTEILTETPYDVSGIVHKQILIKRIEIESLSGDPEVVPHQHTVLIAQVVEVLRCACACPVADHIEVRLLVEDEVWLKMLS